MRCHRLVSVPIWGQLRSRARETEVDAQRADKRGARKRQTSQTHPPCPIRLLQMRSFCCTSRWSSLSYWGCLQCCSETGAAGPGQTTSGGACFIFSQLLSWCFKHGSVATAVSPYSNQVCERRPAKLATSAASSSTGFSGCSTTRAPCGFSGCSTPSLVFLLLGHGGDSHPLHVGAGANLLSFGRFQNVDGIGAGLGWFQR